MDTVLTESIAKTHRESITCQHYKPLQQAGFPLYLFGRNCAIIRFKVGNIPPLLHLRVVAISLRVRFCAIEMAK